MRERESESERQEERERAGLSNAGAGTQGRPRIGTKERQGRMLRWEVYKETEGQGERTQELQIEGRSQKAVGREVEIERVKKRTRLLPEAAGGAEPRPWRRDSARAYSGRERMRNKCKGGIG